MKKKSGFSLPSKYIFLFLAIICIGAIFVTFTTKITTGPVKVAVGYTIVPLQNGINKVGSWFQIKSIEHKSLKKMTKENSELQAKIDELTIENNQLRQDRFELDRLRELYQLDQKYTGYKKVAARITGKDAGNWFHMFVIDKGTKDGIKVDMNVIAGTGLVGRIIETGPNWATVKTIIDDTSNVSGIDLATQDLCTISGDLTLMKDNVIRIQKLVDADNNVAVGDQIVTSPISDKYLEGILIGYVKDIKDDPNKLTKSGFLSPAVDFEHLQEVLVITNLKE